jgi:hypothetical protein
MPVFLSPLFLIAAAAIAIPLALHLRKRDPEPRLKFAAVALLRHAPVERTSTRRLRELLLLMLRVAALLLLALAFARPFFPSAAAAQGATVVALDTSFSLSSPGRFARAQQLAREAVAGATAGDDVGVLIFADRAQLVVPPSADRAAALAAIAAATPGRGGTRYLDAVSLAGRALGGRPGSIVVVTDLQASGWDAGEQASVPASTRVVVRDVGPLPDNLAVISLRAEGGGVIPTVRNDSDRARAVTVRLTIDGRLAAERVLTPGAHASVEAIFSGLQGREAVATIDDPDGLQADNSRYAVLRGGAQTELLSITSTGDLDRDAFYVLQAIGSADSHRPGAGLAGVSAGQIGDWSGDRIAQYRAILLLSTRGLDRRGREALATFVAGGGGLLVVAGPDVDGDVASEIMGASVKLQLTTPDEQDRRSSEPQRLAPADVRHPVFEAFGPAAGSFGLVRFDRVARISGSGCQTLAKFTSGDAALIDCPIGDGRTLVLASDLNNQWNDFPLHATFVPFLQEAVRYLAAGRRANEYLVGEVPSGVAPEPGLVTIREDAGRSRRVAVNVDPAESDPTRISGDEFAAAVLRLKEAGTIEAQAAEVVRESGQHLWQYLLTAMLVALAAESLVAGRTV